MKRIQMQSAKASWIHSLPVGEEFQTRRIIRNVKVAPGAARIDVVGKLDALKEECWPYVIEHAHYKVGDVVAIAEAWAPQSDQDTLKTIYDENDRPLIWYRDTCPNLVAVDGDGFRLYRKDGTECSPWKSARFMPAWAARSFARVESVTVQRVQDIAGDWKALAAEGFPFNGRRWPTFEEEKADMTQWYAELFDRINGKGAWDRNDWVFAYLLERCERP